MNKTEEAQLSNLAQVAKELRECVNAADSMLLSWSWRKAEAGEIYVSLSARRNPRWHAGIHLPAAVVQSILMPVIERIRDESLQKLRAMDPAILTRELMKEVTR